MNRGRRWPSACRLATLCLLAPSMLACGSGETVSGVEAQAYLRNNLGPQPGVDLDPATFSCPLDEEIGAGESMICLANGSDGVVYEFEVKAYLVDGELRLVLDTA